MATETTKTEVGSYFIANYPPFSQWSAAALADVNEALHSPPAEVPLGLYLHIPFCRKRCKFCYFRVYTDKNASDVETYVAALSREIELVSRLPVMGGRPLCTAASLGSSAVSLKYLFHNVRPLTRTM